MKNIMITITILRIIGITFFGVAAPVSATIQVTAAPQDELWQKAQKIAAENRWIPGTIEQYEKVTDTKGKLLDETTTELQFFLRRMTTSLSLCSKPFQMVKMPPKTWST